MERHTLVSACLLGLSQRVCHGMRHKTSCEVRCCSCACRHWQQQAPPTPRKETLQHKKQTSPKHQHQGAQQCSCQLTW